MCSKKYLKYILLLAVAVTFLNFTVFLKFKKNHFSEAVDKETLIENANDLIYRFVDLPLDLKYGSAAIPLVACGLITFGDILELGMGTFSTNVLHRIGICHSINEIKQQQEY